MPHRYLTLALLTSTVSLAQPQPTMAETKAWLESEGVKLLGAAVNSRVVGEVKEESLDNVFRLLPDDMVGSVLQATMATLGLPLPLRPLSPLASPTLTSPPPGLQGNG